MDVDDDGKAKVGAEAVLGSAVRRYVEAVGDPFRVDHTVQVTSFGGSGTTALVDRLLAAGVDLQKGPAQWPFKHHRIPPAGHEVPAGFRVVYVVGDPRDAVLSLFRRGYQFGHYEALHAGRSPGPDVAADLQSLDDFLAGGVDHFELADHVERWLHHPPGYPVMVVRYDHLAESWPQIDEFVGIGPGAPAFAARDRRSDWRSAPPEVQQGLERLYGELADRIASLPPVSVA